MRKRRRMWKIKCILSSDNLQTQLIIQMFSKFPIISTHICKYIFNKKKELNNKWDVYVYIRYFRLLHIPCTRIYIFIFTSDMFSVVGFSILSITASINNINSCRKYIFNSYVLPFFLIHLSLSYRYFTINLKRCICIIRVIGISMKRYWINVQKKRVFHWTSPWSFQWLSSTILSRPISYRRSISICVLW